MQNKFWTDYWQRRYSRCITQMYHPDVQKYVREKEPKDPTEASELVIRYFQLHGIDELKYVKNKPWTHKTREERSGEEKSFPKRESKPHGKWNGHQNNWRRHFKDRSNDSHQDTEGNSSNSTNNKGAEGAKATQSTGSSGSQLSNSNSNGTSHEGAGETRRCHYCGKIGHLMKDCRKRKHVAAAHVPSLQDSRWMRSSVTVELPFAS